MAEQTTRSVRQQRPSIYDVAKVAGVSHMTVSRVLNGHPNIRDSTRTKVLQAIAETNFTRSSIARALATRRTMRIGVIVDAPVQYGPNSTLRALESAARRAGYAISAFSLSEDEDHQIESGLVELVPQGIEALCVIAPRASSLDVLRQQGLGMPTVVIKAEPETAMHTAAVDQQAGASLAVSHLIELGHRRIMHLAGPLDWYDARGREQAWRQTLTAAGLPVVEPVVGDWTSGFGHHVGATHDFSQTTAIFVGNDQMALGLLHGLASRGIRVPQDVSVVGFDDLPDAAHFLPPLTTVRQDFAALGALALEMVLAALEGDSTTGQELIAAELVVRESTAPPPA
ncbi:LacI family DNA-binding transcriptional regulator [Actinotalea sp. BY-33]|uniref:LacI family DNA-binding transcriptional regulator n=1 Tax=Actinotalea soli TaxID=2819234 RepID=A0A939LQQ3_9CELL|nr:LacI family DNA-binding transcriptional regulator [Actinotalea soli]MBO1752073.1 LacI family DNA-binding transcriptional regulator [Actinotalea soli]